MIHILPNNNFNKKLVKQTAHNNEYDAILIDKIIHKKAFQFSINVVYTFHGK